MPIALIFLSATSFGLTIALTRWLIKRFGQLLLDLPNDRSSHTQPTPRGGGLGFLSGFVITALIAQSGYFRLPETFSVLIPAPLGVIAVLLPLGIVGLVDDRRDVPAKVRYTVQLSAAAIALLYFGFLSQPWLPQNPIFIGLVGLSVLVGFTALINFYNFMDGLDGLVASVTALQLAFLAIYLQQPLWWLMVAALLGFLWWNWSPAKIFMGDVGSTVLGACIAIALIAPTAEPIRSLSALAITLPLTADAIYTLARRFLKGENIFQAHRTHVYQRLQQVGWSHQQVAIAYLVSTAGVAVLIAVWQAGGSLLSIGLSGLLIGLSEAYLARHRQIESSSS